MFINMRMMVHFSPSSHVDTTIYWCILTFKNENGTYISVKKCRLNNHNGSICKSDFQIVDVIVWNVHM